MNKNDIEKAYIDADYYKNVFKPNKNAMISGNFNKVAEHVADFDAFRQRASELVDRITRNKITEAGGIDFVSPTPYIFIRKATAAIVQHWYIAGYVVADIDNTLNIGSLNFRQAKNNSSFRKLVPLDALLLIQKSGLWDNRVFAYDVTKQLFNWCIDPKDILLLSDALNIFQQKGNYDNNFHVDIDFSSELTNTNNDRWIKIVETTKQYISFEIMGGSSSELSKALIMINKDDFTPTNSDAFIYSQKALINQTEPSFFVQNTNGTLSVYVKVKDNIADTHFLISNIYADEVGEYKLFGSVQNSNNLTELTKANILQAADLSALTQQIAQVEADIQTIQGEVAKINSNESEINNLKPRVTKLEQDLNNVSTQQNTNTTNITSNSQKINSLENKVNNFDTEVIKKDGSVPFNVGYTPSTPQAPATKKYIDNLEATLRNDFQTLSGYETLWDGSISFTQIGSTDEYEADISVITPQVGKAFDFGAKKSIQVSLRTTNNEETLNTKIISDNKWDDALREHNSKNSVVIVQIRVTPNGKIILRAIDENTNVVAPIPEVPTLVALEQINGNVYTSNTVTVEDSKITELEGINI